MAAGAQTMEPMAPAIRTSLPEGACGDTILIPVKLCNLPPFHPVASKLAFCSDDAEFDVRRMVAIVGGDPALAAEILFLANSSLFGFPARIHSLRHAVAVLGANCVRRLAMTVAMRSLARGAGPLVRSSWCHSVACAVIAETLAPEFGCSAEQAYTAGLLHDVGRLGFLRSYPSEIGPVLARDYENIGAVIAAERQAMNASHGEAGAWLIEYWALPAVFMDTCAHHHEELQESDSPLLRATKTACRLADAIGYTAVRYENTAGYAETVHECSAYGSTRSFPAESRLCDEVVSRLKIFA